MDYSSALFSLADCFLFGRMLEKQVEQDAKDSSACHTGHLHAKEGDIPSKGIAARPGR